MGPGGCQLELDWGGGGASCSGPQSLISSCPAVFLVAHTPELSAAPQPEICCFRGSSLHPPIVCLLPQPSVHILIIHSGAPSMNSVSGCVLCRV